MIQDQKIDTQTFEMQEFVNEQTKGLIQQNSPYDSLQATNYGGQLNSNPQLKARGAKQNFQLSSWIVQQSSNQNFQVIQEIQIQASQKTRENTPIQIPQIYNTKVKQISKKEKAQTEKKACLKNFLNVVKKLFINYFMEREIDAKKAFQHHGLGGVTNRHQFQLLFCNKQYELTLIQMFTSKYLERQIQNARMDHKNRFLFRNYLSLIKKGFAVKRLPNL